MLNKGAASLIFNYTANIAFLKLYSAFCVDDPMRICASKSRQRAGCCFAIKIHSLIKFTNNPDKELAIIP